VHECANRNLSLFASLKLCFGREKVNIMIYCPRNSFSTMTERPLCSLYCRSSHGDSRQMPRPLIILSCVVGLGYMGMLSSTGCVWIGSQRSFVPDFHSWLLEMDLECALGDCALHQTILWTPKTDGGRLVSTAMYVIGAAVFVPFGPTREGSIDFVRAC
jgi:hypothetical protein